MVRKIIKIFLIKLSLPLDLKNILDRRALKNKHTLEAEIIHLIKIGLSENEIMHEQANIFINKVLDARRRRRERKTK